MKGIPLEEALCCLRQPGSVNRPICVRMKERADVRDKSGEYRSEPGSCAGKSLLEQMEEMLDEVFEQLMDRDNFPIDQLENAKGKAQGIAECLALFHQSYFPNVDAVKGAAVLRYRARHETLDPSASETTDQEVTP